MSAREFRFPLLLLVVGGVGLWQMLEHLTPDTQAMMVGLLMGSLAGVPTTLLTIYTMRESRSDDVRPAVPMVERPAVPMITVERPAVRRVSDGRHQQRRLEARG